MKPDGGLCDEGNPSSPVAPIIALADSFLSKEAVAKLLGVSTATLLRWHNLRKGPPRLKCGRSIRYLRQAVEDWGRVNSK